MVESTTEFDKFEKSTGLVLPGKEGHTPAPSTGIVIQVGNGFKWWHRLLDHSIPREGDMVMFSKYAGSNYRVDENNFKVLDWRELFCSLEADGSMTEEV